MPFNRWNDMVDILERLNVTDPAVWTPQITRGFTYMGIMIEHTGIEGHPEIKRAIHRMFERMPQELVFANPRVTPAAKNSMPNIWASPTLKSATAHTPRTSWARACITYGTRGPCKL